MTVITFENFYGVVDLILRPGFTLQLTYQRGFLEYSLDFRTFQNHKKPIFLLGQKQNETCLTK